MRPPVGIYCLDRFISGRLGALEGLFRSDMEP